jgi:hypothetical protein
MSDLCHYCGRYTVKVNHSTLYGRTPPDNMRTEDHVIPKSAGGHKGPIVICCLRCNQVKSSYDYEEFKLFASIMLRGKRPSPSLQTTGFAFEAWRCARLF